MAHSGDENVEMQHETRAAKAKRASSRDRLSSLEDKVERLEGNMGDSVERLDAVEGRVDELETNRALNENVNAALNQLSDSSEKKGDAFQAALIALKEEFQAKIEKLEIEPNQTYLLDDGTILETELIFYNKLENIPKNDCIKWFDYDKIIGTLFLRKREKGDYLTIRDDGARKSLQDYLVNEKVPKGIRDNIRVLADGSHIVWVMGKRISTHYKVSANTTRILQIRIGGKYLD